MKRGLGRGLSALIGEKLELEEISQDGLSKILIENILANPNQPRVIFHQTELEELVDSIRQNGILQPILVKPLEDGKYEIVAGERRWRAAKMLGLEEIPAIIKDIAEHQALEIALIENIQRENLNPLEEAETYQRLIEEHQYTQERMAEVVSKSRSHVANLLRLLTLSEKIKNHLKEGSISLGHAKLLISHPDNDRIVDFIVNNKMNVRQTEDLLKHGKEPQEKPIKSPKKTESKSDDILAIEEYISEGLGLPVEVEHSTRERGRISVYFDGMEELDLVVKRLTRSIA